MPSFKSHFHFFSWYKLLNPGNLESNCQQAWNLLLKESQRPVTSLERPPTDMISLKFLKISEEALVVCHSDKILFLNPLVPFVH